MFDPTRSFECMLHDIGRLANFEKFKLVSLLKGHPMDPVTAIFAFLATSAGQNVVEDLRKIDAAFVALISGLVKKIHDKQAA